MPERNAKKAARSSKPRGEDIRRECIAHNAGACDETGVCLECSPVHQAMRTAGWALARWPRIKGSRRA
ncbi:MAG: hypothetical protein HY017_30365 [Betaproteobacteria bacterium]|nr:hypothetical protein [Betaproteobacteria bacterium]